MRGADAVRLGRDEGGGAIFDESSTIQKFVLHSAQGGDTFVVVDGGGIVIGVGVGVVVGGGGGGVGDGIVGVRGDVAVTVILMVWVLVLVMVLSRRSLCCRGCRWCCCRCSCC